MISEHTISVEPPSCNNDDEMNVSKISKLTDTATSFSPINPVKYPPSPSSKLGTFK